MCVDSHAKATTIFQQKFQYLAKTSHISSRKQISANNIDSKTNWVSLVTNIMAWPSFLSHDCDRDDGRAHDDGRPCVYISIQARANDASRDH